MYKLEEYIFAILFGFLTWLSSLQFAKLYPHNVKYGRYVLYLHSLLCLLGIYNFILIYYKPTQLHTNIRILLLFCIPAHFELFITNFIIFQWLKIYFSVGVTEGWLITFKRAMLCLSMLSFTVILTLIVLISFNPFTHLLHTIFTIVMCTVGTYCLSIAIAFISVAVLLMHKVLQTSNMSGIATNKSVCKRLLGSGIILSVSYLTQGIIIYLLVFESKSDRIMRWIVSVFQFCTVLIMINTLLLYSKIIQQRLKNHWRKWAKSNKLWDLNASSKKRRKKNQFHTRIHTEELAFDPADIRLLRALSSGTNLHSNVFSQTSVTDTKSVLPNKYTSLNRKVTQKYDKVPLSINSEAFDMEMTDFEAMELFDELALNNSTDNEESEVEIMEENAFVIGDDIRSVTVDVIENEETMDRSVRNVMDFAENELSNEAQSLLQEIVKINMDSTMPILETIKSGQSYSKSIQNCIHLSGNDMESINVDMICEETVLKGHISDDTRDEKVLTDLFDNGLHSPVSPTQTQEKSMHKLQLHTPESPMTPIDENNKRKSLNISHTLNISHIKNPSSAPQTPIKKIAKISPKPKSKSTKKWKVEKTKPGSMLKSKSFQNTSSKVINKLSLSPNSDYESQTPKRKINKRKKRSYSRKKHGKKSEYSYLTQPINGHFHFSKSGTDSDSNQGLLDSALSSYAETEDGDTQFESEYLSNQSPKSINHTQKSEIIPKNSNLNPPQILRNRSRSALRNPISESVYAKHKRGMNLMSVNKIDRVDIDYRKTKEYKNMHNECDIIGNSCSNPRFWKYLRQKHTKKINPKALQKFTFSFEKSRYQSLISRENRAITPCSSPRLFGMPQSTRAQITNSAHFRSASAQYTHKTQSANVKPSKQKKPTLHTIPASPQRSPETETLTVIDTNIEVSLPKSPTKSKSSTPQTVLKKSELTPLASFTKTFFGGHNKLLSTEIINKEYTKLNTKRKNLEIATKNKTLDISGVAAKLDYWQSNELKNDPRWKVLHKRQKMRHYLSSKRDSNSEIENSKNKVQKWKNMFGFGKNAEFDIAQQQALQAQQSPYIGGTEIDAIDRWSSDSLHSSSDSEPDNVTSSESGQYSNSEDSNGAYDNIRNRNTKKRKRIKHKRRKHSKIRAQKNKTSISSLHIFSDKTDVIKYNKTPIFTGATDSEVSDSDYKPLQLSQNNNDSMHYMRAKSSTLKSPKTCEDIIEWQCMDVFEYIMQVCPGLECYENNIIDSEIKGVEFVCMQSVQVFRKTFGIKNASHIAMLLRITNDLLMGYNGNNKRILNAKSNGNLQNINL